MPNIINKMNTHKEERRLGQKVAREFLLGNDTGWKSHVRDAIMEQFNSATVDLFDTTRESLVRDIRSYANDALMEVVEEFIWENLSERETFDEQRWQSVSDKFRTALNGWLANEADVLADDIFTIANDDAEYSGSPSKFFGHSDNDF